MNAPSINLGEDDIFFCFEDILDMIGIEPMGEDEVEREKKWIESIRNIFIRIPQSTLFFFELLFYISAGVLSFCILVLFAAIIIFAWLFWIDPSVNPSYVNGQSFFLLVAIFYSAALTGVIYNLNNWLRSKIVPVQWSSISELKIDSDTKLPAQIRKMVNSISIDVGDKLGTKEFGDTKLLFQKSSVCKYMILYADVSGWHKFDDKKVGFDWGHYRYCLYFGKR
ncbi:hypothetical protein ACFL22_00425 [Patescibacteria group bacterium]